MVQPASPKNDEELSILSRQIRLVGPERLRSGEEALMKLIIDPSDPGNAPTEDNLEEHFNLVMEARLEVDGTLFSPDGEVFSPLSFPQPTVFEWKIRPEEKGQVDGILWLHLSFLPLANPSSELPPKKIFIAAPRITIPVISFFGLGMQTVKIIGIVASGLSFFMVLEPSLRKQMKKMV
jgi:hypothetical protein